MHSRCDPYDIGCPECLAEPGCPCTDRGHAHAIRSTGLAAGSPISEPGSTSAPRGGRPACGPRTRWRRACTGSLERAARVGRTSSARGQSAVRSCVVPQDPDPQGVQVVRRRPPSLDLEPGVTVVVGPNGSGKSNVVDAIGWVLGAQAPSAVRSQKMDDVIFAGTAKRTGARAGPRSSLTIDNTSGMLPIEFTEVTITRTLFRSGDSEYAINGVPCRLLDIQELLSDTGVGRQQHVIISQGQIDAVLNARPEERRLHHRRGGRRAEVPPAQGEERAPPGRHRGQPHPAPGPAARGAPPAAPARAPGRRGPPSRRRGGRARARCASTWPAASWPRLRARLERPPRTRGRAAARPSATLQAPRWPSSTRRCMATEAQLTAMGGDDLGDALAQFESLCERARGLASLLAERRRGIDRDRSAFVDQGVDRHPRGRGGPAGGRARRGRGRGRRARAARAAELAAAEAALADAARRASRTDWADGVAAAERPGRRGAGRAGGAAVERRARRGRAGPGARRGSTGWPRSRRGWPPRPTGCGPRSPRPSRPSCRWSRRSTGPSSGGPTAEAALAEAEDAQRAAESEHHAWVARAEALALALDEARSRGRRRAAGRRRRRARHPARPRRDRRRLGGGLRGRRRRGARRRRGRRRRRRPAGRSQAPARRAHRRRGAGRCGRAAERRPRRRSGEPVRRHVRGAVAAAARRSTRLLDALVGAAVVVDGGWAEAVDVGAGPSRRHRRHPGGRPVRRRPAGGSAPPAPAPPAPPSTRPERARPQAAAPAAGAAADWPRPTEARRRGPRGPRPSCRGSSTTTTVA